MSDDKDLKAWCHWKRKEKDLSEDDALFVKAIEDAISQAGMVPQLRAQLAEAMTANKDQADTLWNLAKELTETQAKLGTYESDVVRLVRENATLETKLTEAQMKYEAMMENCDDYQARLVKALTKLGLATEALEQYKWWPMGTPVNCKIAHEALAKLRGRYISPDDAQFMSDMNKKSPHTSASYKALLRVVARSIDWDEQNASRFYIGEDAAEAVLVRLGFPFDTGQCNESVERFLARPEKTPVADTTALYRDALEYQALVEHGYSWLAKAALEGKPLDPGQQDFVNRERALAEKECTHPALHYGTRVCSQCGITVQVEKAREDGK